MIQRKAMLINITLCVGCNGCQDALKVQNKLREGANQALSAKHLHIFGHEAVGETAVRPRQLPEIWTDDLTLVSEPYRAP
jgi:Fe-S-cluster-containing dehydrogenase component